MSHDITKTVLRAEFPELKGMSRAEVYPFYQKLMGDAPELEMYQGKMDYFSYERAGLYQECCDVEDNRWGVEKVLQHESCYGAQVEMKPNGYSMGELNEMAREMAESFGIDPNQIRYISYTWHTGTDEPVAF